MLSLFSWMCNPPFYGTLFANRIGGPAVPQTGGLFSNRNFVLLFSGQSLSSIGTNVYSFALLWDMKVMTQNAFLMSLVGLGWALPQVLFGPIAGVVVDRFSKRWIMFLSDAVRFLLVVIVTMLSYFHSLNAWEMIVMAFLSNTVATVFNPAAGTLTPIIVSHEQLPSANGLQQAAGPASMILGPAISAGLIAYAGVTASFGLNALTFFISVATLLFMTLQEPFIHKKPITTHHVFAEMKEGFVAIKGIKLLMVLFPVAFMLNFMFAPTDLYIVQYVTEILHGNQVLVGEMNAVFAVGMLLGAVLTGFIGRFFRAGFMVGGGLLISTLMTAIMVIYPQIFFDLFCMFIGGFGMSLVNVTIMTLLQQVVEKTVMGRVFALLNTMFGAAMPLGMLIGGIAASLFNVRIVLGITGLIGVLLAILTLSFRTIRDTKQLAVRVN